MLIRVIKTPSPTGFIKKEWWGRGGGGGCQYLTSKDRIIFAALLIDIIVLVIIISVLKGWKLKIGFFFIKNCIFANFLFLRLNYKRLSIKQCNLAASFLSKFRQSCESCYLNKIVISKIKKTQSTQNLYYYYFYFI